MEYFLTTYAKDYSWPVAHSEVKSQKQLCLKTELLAEAVKGEPCAGYHIQPVEEPKIDAAQCGAPPVGPESKHGQPQTYLKKLYSKYPYLYNILKLSPPEELAKHVYSDKYVTTYNADYKIEGFSPMKDLLVPQLSEGVAPPDPSLLAQCQPPEQQLPTQSQPSAVTDAQPKCNCPPDSQCHCIAGMTQKRDVPRKPVSRISTISKLPKPAREKKEEKTLEYTGGKKAPKLGKWNSEYRDTISRIGGIIMTKKLLSRPPKEPESS